MKMPLNTDIKAIVRSSLNKSVASLLIKVMAAGLTYVMFVVLSRSMSEVNYGQFAFGFSLATILAIGASMGQQIAILRFWPEENGNNNPKKAHEALRSGWAIVILASIIISLTLIFTALVGGVIGDGIFSFLYIIAAASLILPLAMAEYGGSVLRAQESVWIALTPRDVLWRAGVPTIVVILLFYGVELNGSEALLLSAVILSFVMVIQFFVAKKIGFYNSIGFSSLKNYWNERGKISLWFFISTVLDTAALNVDIILIGLFVAVESAGLYFNAFKTAGLMTLFMWAITLVIAPIVAKHYHAGEIKKAQAVTTFCAWAGFIFSVGIFIIFIFFGDLILSLFGDTYANGKTILLLLSAGLLVDAATGPTRIVMMMTGHEKAYVAIFGSIMLAGFVCMLVIIPIYGVLGAAIVNMITRIIAQSAIAYWAKKKIGISTTLWGFWTSSKEIIIKNK